MFGENNPDMYDKCFSIAGVTYPAAPDDFIHLVGNIQGNYKLEKTVWPALMSISPDNFWPLGRFAHIFIPKYVYVPREVFTYLNIQLPKGNKRQFCYAARHEANKWTEGSDITQSTSHWTDILLDTKATNNMQFNLIDAVQAEAAQKWKATMLKTERLPYVWYDLFIQPIKVIYARKTALNEKLVMAMKCQQHAKEFYHLVCNLTNIPNTLPLTAVECIEEMSKIRHLTAKQLTQTSATDVPMATTQKVRLQSSDIRTWNMVCEEDIASSSSSSGRG